MIKKLISLLLIMVFAIPLAPVMQVGGLLYQNQLSEENSAHSLSVAKQGDATEQENDHAVLLKFTWISSVPHKIIDETLLSRQKDDITTPPPNAAI